jgi:hypothetical protein
MGCDKASLSAPLNEQGVFCVSLQPGRRVSGWWVGCGGVLFFLVCLLRAVTVL